MFSKSFYSLSSIIFFCMLIILVSRSFLNDSSKMSIFYLIYWIDSVLILTTWISMSFANINKYFGGEIKTIYSEIRKEIQKNKKIAVFLFLYFQIINASLFIALGLTHAEIKYNDSLEVLCITILFISCWEYFNYYRIFRKEILKGSLPYVSDFFHSFQKSSFFFLEGIIIIYQVVTSIYFILLTNENVTTRSTLNCYLKLMFVLYVFKILGPGCHKYLKKMLICATLFALIIYDWYMFINILTGNFADDQEYFNFFIIIFILTHGFFLMNSYSLYKEWHIYRNERRPRAPLGNHFLNNIDLMINPNHNNQNKIGLTEEEIKLIPSVVYKNNQILDAINCTICTFDICDEEKIINIPCSHTFHYKCIVPWFKINKVCPNCRKVIAISEKNEIICYSENIEVRI